MVVEVGGWLILTPRLPHPPAGDDQPHWLRRVAGRHRRAGINDLVKIVMRDMPAAYLLATSPSQPAIQPESFGRAAVGGR
jgi:hypothetical protein